MEEELALVESEQDSLRSEAELQAAAAGTLARELEIRKTDLQQKETAVAEAHQLASSSRSEAQVWKEKAEGNFHQHKALL